MGVLISQKNKAGFTLIELLLYTALTIVMIALLGGIGVSVLESRTKAHALEEVHYTAQFVFEKITASIQSAESVNGLEPQATGTVLSLEMADQSKNPTVFELHEGGVLFTEGTQNPVMLSTSGVLITDLIFTNVSALSSSPSIRVELRTDAYNGEGRRAFDIDYSFFTTVNSKQ